MNRNVNEWYWDWYSNLRKVECDEYPCSVAFGSFRDLCGGSWNWSAEFCTVSYPNEYRREFGFRLVRSRSN